MGFILTIFMVILALPWGDIIKVIMKSVRSAQVAINQNKISGSEARENIISELLVSTSSSKPLPEPMLRMLLELCVLKFKSEDKKKKSDYERRINRFCDKKGSYKRYSYDPMKMYLDLGGKK